MWHWHLCKSKELNISKFICFNLTVTLSSEHSWPEITLLSISAYFSLAFSHKIIIYAVFYWWKKKFSLLFPLKAIIANGPWLIPYSGFHFNKWLWHKIFWLTMGNGNNETIITVDICQDIWSLACICTSHSLLGNRLFPN